ncbi:Ribosomal RNA large subunit methyltransferase I [Pirellulimonas nuda]|uniref:Ribosomal RNA large subunit methyltransferase I n=1 Tax=Pirellulimonas nuda TaxID=2528009 RepID=A0A518D767_9BACT|nr:class I SAM-dependent methyltransferase [Pirellulimonas nuda]QDU87301.1 Ribosomal RNA large subunit methyltransferase I [Pirellulimonas nuda]
MSDWPDYELIDFGAGRKLERFGGLLVDRPCPAAADATRRDTPHWREPKAVYTGAKVGDGKWRVADGVRPALSVPLNIPLSEALGFGAKLDLSPAGQVGLFPEQFENWQWIAAQARRAGRPLRVLNLFAYTGGSTLAAAAAGCEVTHVDASKPSVALARENAALSGLEGAPVRWIIEDAVKYCEREVRRGSRYDGVILDPPSYGHGPKGEDWRLERDLLPLLEICGELVDRRPVFFLLTCHTPGVGPAELAAYLSDGLFGSCGQPPATGTLYLRTPDRRRLESGVFARWPG